MKSKLIGVLLLCFFAAVVFPQNSEPEPAADTNQDQASSLPDEDTLKLNLDTDQNTENDNDQEANAPGAVGLKASDFIRMVLFLGVIIAIIYAFFAILKKVSGRNMQTSTDMIDVLGSQVLKGDASLHLVQVGNELLLLGSGSGSVNLIKEITDKETADDIKLRASSSGSEKGNFISLLAGKLSFGKQTRSAGNTTAQSRDFIKSQRDKLKKL